MTDPVEAIFNCYSPGDQILVLLQGGRAFEGKLSWARPGGYIIIVDTSGTAKRDVHIPLSAIVAVTRPW